MTVYIPVKITALKKTPFLSKKRQNKPLFWTKNTYFLHLLNISLKYENLNIAINKIFMLDIIFIESLYKQGDDDTLMKMRK